MKISEVHNKRLLIKVPEIEEKTKGGLYVPDNAMQEMVPVKCEIVGVGHDCHPSFKVGSFVLVNKISTLDTRMLVDKDARLVVVNEADVFVTVVED